MKSRYSLLVLALTIAAWWQAILPSALAAEPSVEALEKQMQQLDQELRVLKRKLELEAEEEKARPTPRVNFGDKGFALESADGNFRLGLRGYLQADSRFFAHDGGVVGNDSFLIRRARPIFEGTVFKQFEFRLMPDFAGSSTTLQDGYLTWKLWPELQIQAGKFKAPVGLERLQSATALSFVERGFPTALVPNRDIGVQLQGSLFENRLEYAVGAFNGTTDAGSVIVDNDDEKDIAGRLFAHPFRGQQESAWGNLGVGIAGTYGTHEGTPQSYVTSSQQAFFAWNNGVVNDGVVWRLTPQAYYYRGPFGLLGEYAVSSQEIRLGTALETLTHSAWQLVATYVLTGEAASYRGVKPKHPFDLANSDWGAFELAARYGELDLDNDSFPVFANPNTRPTKARSVGVGVNWYLNANVKLSTDYNFTEFDGGDVPTGHAIFSRFQISF